LIHVEELVDRRSGADMGPTPAALRNRPQRRGEQVTGAEVPDGLLLGDRAAISDALFDPRTGTWTDIPPPPDHEPSAAPPQLPGAHRLDFAHAYLGGPNDIGQVDFLRDTS
jgi:hypothetical protein